MDSKHKYLLLELMTMCLAANAVIPNITVAILIERSAILDMPFIINRTIGIIELATSKAREITKHSANLDFIVRYADVPACVSLKWGALAAEVYHGNDIQAIIGPGMYTFRRSNGAIFIIAPFLNR